jgi:hypothetical protein
MLTAALIKAFQVYGIAIAISAIVALLIKAMVSITNRLENMKPVEVPLGDGLPDRTRRPRGRCRRAVGGDLRHDRAASRAAHRKNRQSLGQRRARRPAFPCARPPLEEKQDAQTFQGNGERTRI